MCGEIAQVENCLASALVCIQRGKRNDEVIKIPVKKNAFRTLGEGIIMCCGGKSKEKPAQDLPIFSHIPEVQGHTRV